MAGDSAAPPPSRAEFAGSFEAEERDFLASRFSRCTFELLARSATDERVVLLRWRDAGARPDPRGPAPLFRPPGEATYVLDRVERVVPGPPLLVRVDSTAALQQLYPGHFPDVQVKVPPASWWGRLFRHPPGSPYR